MGDANIENAKGFTSKERSDVPINDVLHHKNEPLKDIFGKLESPKYDFYGVTMDDEKNLKSDNKPIVESKLYSKVIIYFFIIIFVLINTLPNNVLDIIPLQYLVDFISIINPLITNFDRQSKFPEATRLIYSLCVITIPLQVLVIHKVLGSELANFLNKKTRDELNIGYYSFILFSVIPIMFIYILPLIGPRSSITVRHYHTVKASYALVTTLAFFFNAVVISIIISCREKIKNLKIKGQ